MPVRLTRKLADFIDGIDLSHRTVGELIDLPEDDARRIVAEGWAEFERGIHQQGRHPGRDGRSPPQLSEVLVTRKTGPREAALRMTWLFKEEPSSYSFDALAKDKRAVWSGVKNPLAQKHLHAVKRGDRIFYYHTGNEKAVVGIATALGDAYPDPQDKTGKSAVVDIGPVKKLPRPVTLAEIKADPAFKTFPLVRISRLSVMPVTDEEWERVERMAASGTRTKG